MLAEVLVFLRERVNDHLRTAAGWRPTDLGSEPVRFPGDDKVDTIHFLPDCVTLLLVNVEEEHALRPADPHRRTLPDGTTQHVNPPIQVNAYVLFVARFADYEKSLRQLSRILHYFQSHRGFDRESAPGLPDKIDKLTLELLTLPLSEQNLLWSVLRAAYLPSLLYKVRAIVFSDEQGTAPPLITETISTVAPGGAP